MLTLQWFDFMQKKTQIQQQIETTEFEQYNGRERSPTGEVFVLLDGEFDNVVCVLKDAGAVLKRAVVQPHVVDRQQLISRLDRARSACIAQLYCSPHCGGKILHSI